jgi:hypothetical protein
VSFRGAGGGSVSRAARSVLVFGLYMIAVGAVLVAAPNALLALCRLAPTREVYIRVLGVVVLTLGLYYLAAARAEAVVFFRWTVWGRPLVLVLFIVLAALRLGPPVLVLFGVIDAAGALWTAAALRPRLARGARRV